VALAKSYRLVLIGFNSTTQSLRDLQPALAWEIWTVDDLALDFFDTLIRAHAERRRHLRCRSRSVAGGIGPGQEMIAAQAGLAHHVLEGDVGGVRHRGLKRAAQHAVGRARSFQKYLEVGALHHVGLVAIVEHGETRRHIGLERKLLQKPGAQCVDGLHFQPARRFQRPRKQFAGGLAQLCVGSGNAGVADRRIQLRIVERHPVTERGEHALGHVGGSRLGEGDAEDLFRRHTGKEQADHSLHQHVSLAGARIRRDER